MRGFRKFFVLLAVVGLALTVVTPQVFAGDVPEGALPDDHFHRGDIQTANGVTDDDDGDPGDLGDGYESVDPFRRPTEGLRDVDTILEDLAMFLWTQLMLLP